jgi:fluoride exporter
MGRFLIVCGAGALGCGARYLVGLWVGQRSFPYATLIVNLVGSFLIALVWELALKAGMFSDNMRLALTTGFMGGLTTYSTFNYETTAMANTGHTGRALVYVGATLIGCTIAGLAGLWLARRIS